MKRIVIMAPVLVAVLLLGMIGTDTGTASAANICRQVPAGQTAMWRSNSARRRRGEECQDLGRGAGGWTLVQTRIGRLGTGVACDPVASPGETSDYTESTCSGTPTEGEGGYIEVLYQPEFIPVPTGASAKFTGSDSTSALETSSTSPVDCTSSTAAGEITGATKVGGVVITYSGCSSKEGSGCTVKGSGASAGEIVTNTLDGELGEVATTEAPSGVGLLLLATSGTTFATLEGSCLPFSPSAVEGTIAAEVLPVEAPGSSGKLVFAGSKSIPKIKTILVLDHTVKPSLLALGLLGSSETSTEALKFGEEIEVV
jgi:hypothetical protein